jgi:putative transposon-encoded protein
MVEIKFAKKLTIVGHSRALLVPKAIAELLEDNKVYRIIIEEVEHGKKTDPSVD